MTFTGSPLLATVAVLLASFLMVLSGSAKKHLVMKSRICPVCRRERKRCTCRWL